MDPDISIWQKTGHFYFALTGIVKARRLAEERVSAWHVKRILG
jgi:hypothetical protein